MTIQVTSLLLCLIPIAFVIILAYLTSYVKYSTWPAAYGKMTEASVVEASFRKKYRRGYVAHIKYEYNILNKSYAGENIFSLSITAKQNMSIVSSEQSAVRLINKVSTGKQLIVYYNPKDPNISFLINGPKSTMLLMTLVPLILAGFVTFLHFSKAVS